MASTATRPHTPDGSSTSPPTKGFNWRQIIDSNEASTTGTHVRNGGGATLPSPPGEGEESDTRGLNTTRQGSSTDEAGRTHSRNGSGLSVRERNRIAAHKCRAKSKVVQHELQQRERFLHEQNRYLSAQVHFLKGEVFDLKTAILRHGASGCENITAYMPKAGVDTSSHRHSSSSHSFVP